MKKLVLSFLSGALSLGAFAQAKHSLNQNYNQNIPAVISTKRYKKVDLHKSEEISQKSFQAFQNVAKAVADIGQNETEIGVSYYDLQTNASVCRRIIKKTDGTMAATWTFSNDALSPAFTDRGTGYTFFDGTAWGTQPNLRIESTRTGWPTIGMTDAGEEVTISHGTEIDQLVLNKRSTVGTGTWAETFLSAISPIALWPRFAVGGTNGQTIHLIGLTTPTTFGGTEYNGMDGALLYTRSTDGGTTWDTPIQLPGTGIADYTNISGDVYSIDVKGDKVVIGIAELGQHVKLLISEDNGTSWTQKLAINNGIGKFDEAVNQADFIPTSGGSIATLIDNNGKVHTFFDHVGISNGLGDDVVGDGSIGLYLYGGNPESFISADSGVFIGGDLGSFGLGYWNEDFEEGDWKTIGSWYYDFDQSQTFSELTDNIDGYRLGNMNQFACMPTVSVDANNNIFVLFAALTDYTQGDGNYYRHTFGVASDDGGCSWTFPFDATAGSAGIGGQVFIDPNTQGPLAPDVHDIDDCIYASSVRDIQDTIVDFVMQIDQTPGSFRDNDGNPLPNLTSIVHKQLHVNDFLAFPKLDCFSFVESDLVGDLCASGSATLTAGCGASYEWNDGSTADNITINTPGTYSVIVNTGCDNAFFDPATDAPEDSVVIDTIVYVVEGETAPIAAINGQSAVSSCDPAAGVVLTVTPEPGSTFSWSNGSTGSSTTASAGDVITYTATNCAGTSTSAALTITADSSLMPTATISGFNEICTGQTAALFSNTLPAEANFGATYGWSDGSTGNSVTANPGDQVILTITNCAGTATDTVDVFISPLPTPVINAPVVKACEGVGLTLEATGANSFTWSDGSTGNTLFLDEATQTGSYTVTGENLCSETATSNSVSIVIDPAPTAPVVSYVYNDPSFDFTSDATGTHTWYYAGTAILNNTSSTYSTTTMAQGIQVYATITDALGCESQPSNIITAIPVGINDLGQVTTAKVFPNPTAGRFTLELNNAQNAVVSVRNILGEVVANQIVTANLTDFDLSRFDRGMYFVTINQNNTEKTLRVLLK